MKNDKYRVSIWVAYFLAVEIPMSVMMGWLVYAHYVGRATPECIWLWAFGMVIMPFWVYFCMQWRIALDKKVKT